MKILRAIVSTSTLAGMISVGTVPIAAASPQAAKTRSETACPKGGTIIDNVCYVKTGKKPVISGDPAAKPICYPGVYIKTSTGYSCAMKYSDYKNPE